MDMETEKYLLNILRWDIEDILDYFWFDICNQDWESCEKEFDEVVESLMDDVLEEQPEFLWKYIKDYIEKEYPYNLNK